MDGHPALVTRIFLRWRVFRSPGVSLGRKKRLIFLHPAPWLAEWHIVPQLFFTPTAKGIVPAASLQDVIPGQDSRVTENAAPFALRRDGAGRLEAIIPDAAEQAAVEKILQGCGLENVNPGCGNARSGLKSADAYLGNAGAGPEGASACAEPFSQAPAVWLEAGLSPEVLASWLAPGPFLEKRGRVRTHLAVLQILCTTQLCAGLAMAPLLLADLPLLYVIIGCAASLYGLGLLIAGTFIHAWQRLLPGDNHGLFKAFWMLLYPPASIRAIQTLSPAMRVPCHESAFMLALEEKQGSGVEYLRHVLACLAWRDYSRSLSPAASRALREANGVLAKAMKQQWGFGELPVPSGQTARPGLCNQVAQSAPAALIDPAQLEKGSVCYCPMCGVSMAVPVEYCPQCREIRMLPVDSPAVAGS